MLAKKQTLGIPNLTDKLAASLERLLKATHNRAAWVRIWDCLASMCAPVWLFGCAWPLGSGSAKPGRKEPTPLVLSPLPSPCPVVKPPPWKPAGASVPTPHTGWHPLSCARPPRLAGASRGTYWTPDRVITSSHVTSRVWRGGPVCRSAGSFVVGSAAASGISSNSQDCQQRHGKLPASLPLLPSGPFSCSSQALCRLSQSSASCHQRFVSDEHAAAK
ncbi:hypothetical protein SISNIDRAFT_505639 [Sistotremastrum niveocremeum HHB9708]|uniref:Uncharacterized protein n=1 Tax=Sistotremastrum niveocremeum HHB9708 TaxID=1314777 RepID=A0A164UWT9_9AGAM|nr:hypothetical protein SISNIDRAFT_505639 [Sistotremastrum niveocremeum HHB9708]